MKDQADHTPTGSRYDTARPRYASRELHAHSLFPKGEHVHFFHSISI